MYIDKKELISDIGCKDVRDFLRIYMNTFFTLKNLESSLCGDSLYYKKSLRLSKNKAKQLIRELKTRGFIEKCKEGGEDTWRTTVKGNAFCIAKFLKPLKKKKP